MFSENGYNFKNICRYSFIYKTKKRNQDHFEEIKFQEIVAEEVFLVLSKESNIQLRFKSEPLLLIKVVGAGIGSVFLAWLSYKLGESRGVFRPKLYIPEHSVVQVRGFNERPLQAPFATISASADPQESSALASHPLPARPFAIQGIHNPHAQGPAVLPRDVSANSRSSHSNRKSRDSSTSKNQNLSAEANKFSSIRAARIQPQSYCLNPDKSLTAPPDLISDFLSLEPAELAPFLQLPPGNQIPVNLSADNIIQNQQYFDSFLRYINSRLSSIPDFLNIKNKISKSNVQIPAHEIRRLQVLQIGLYQLSPESRIRAMDDVFKDLGESLTKYGYGIIKRETVDQNRNAIRNKLSTITPQEMPLLNRLQSADQGYAKYAYAHKFACRISQMTPLVQMNCFGKIFAFQDSHVAAGATGSTKTYNIATISDYLHSVVSEMEEILALNNTAGQGTGLKIATECTRRNKNINNIVLHGQIEAVKREAVVSTQRVISSFEEEIRWEDRGAEERAAMFLRATQNPKWVGFCRE